MLELGPDNVLDYLRAAGRLAPEARATARLLAWGVSNVVLRIDVAGGEDFVVKQSRRQLRTETPWFSRLDRIWRELEVMQELAPRLPTGMVPRVLFADRDNYLFAMQAVRADHTVWKADLLAGRVEPSIARTMGGVLAALHASTAGNDALQRRWGDREVFVQLRVDPFYRHVARVHADLSPVLQRLIDEMFAVQACLVHADFSPKNILVSHDGLTLVDYETAHYGDPAFDIGFFLSHLMLKTVLHADRCAEYLDLARVFWQTYHAALRGACGFSFGQSADSGRDSQSVFERRSVAHLAGCMLARIDGTSTIDYLPHECDRRFVRSFCRELLFGQEVAGEKRAGEKAGIETVFEQFRQRLRERTS